MLRRRNGFLEGKTLPEAGAPVEFAGPLIYKDFRLARRLL
jgi:hypothetical protein